MGFGFGAMGVCWIGLTMWGESSPNQKALLPQNLRMYFVFVCAMSACMLCLKCCRKREMKKEGDHLRPWKRRQKRERIKVIKKLIQYCYNAIVPLGWYFSDIVKFFAILPIWPSSCWVHFGPECQMYLTFAVWPSSSGCSKLYSVNTYTVTPIITFFKPPSFSRFNYVWELHFFIDLYFKFGANKLRYWHWLIHGCYKY